MRGRQNLIFVYECRRGYFDIWPARCCSRVTTRSLCFVDVDGARGPSSSEAPLLSSAPTRNPWHISGPLRLFLARLSPPPAAAEPEARNASPGHSTCPRRALAIPLPPSPTRKAPHPPTLGAPVAIVAPLAAVSSVPPLARIYVHQLQLMTTRLINYCSY
ncbi:hypothetical protein EVAR_25637_1 [Eumeta japonica]|uniref:Uncharacterized protein n=1 Tax=Eumeta variegata TaxID=151549 RepID=A0A4C1V264_EUMVA|nr:hypothetical protein EVAR_25637_1 [Eumeta japonica]